MTEYSQKINSELISKTLSFDDYIWETYNKPWLESALQRGDDIVLWSHPSNFKKIIYKDGTTGPSFYKRVLNYLQSNSIKFEFDYQKSINQGIISK